MGRWVVPRKLELAVTYCEVTLDFTDAVITHDTLRIEVGMTGKTLTLITRPGVVVDTDGLQLVHSGVKYRRTPVSPDTPVVLRVELVGLKAHGRVVVRPPRRTFAQWLLGGPPGAGPRTGPSSPTASGPPRRTTGSGRSRLVVRPARGTSPRRVLCRVQ